MDDPTEDLIRRALRRRTPPSLGPSFAEDVLRKVAANQRHAALSATAGTRRWLAAAMWLATAAASAAVLASVAWSGASRTIAWGLGLVLVPLAYSAALWPRRFAALLALCGGPLPGEGRADPRLATNLCAGARD